MPVEQAAGFVDKLLDQSPVLAVLFLIIIALAIAMVKMNAQHLKVAERFGEVMAESSERGHSQADKALERTETIATVLTGLKTVITERLPRQGG